MPHTHHHLCSVLFVLHSIYLSSSSSSCGDMHAVSTLSSYATSAPSIFVFLLWLSPRYSFRCTERRAGGSRAIRARPAIPSAHLIPHQTPPHCTAGRQRQVNSRSSSSSSRHKVSQKLQCLSEIWMQQVPNSLGLFIIVLFGFVCLFIYLFQDVVVFNEFLEHVFWSYQSRCN